MAIGNVVAYYRFSTLGNRLGLGLEAQWQEVHDYLTGGDWKLVAEVVEVESSKHNSRPRLQEAFALCRAHGARLLIARLDRLARNVTFISTLVERKRDIAFVACDMPEVNEFTIHILAAVAQYEANAISERTKGSLTAVERLHRRTAPKRKRIGNDRRFITNLDKGRDHSAASRKAEADQYATDLLPLTASLRGAGSASLRQIAAAFNERSIPTPREHHRQIVAILKKRAVPATRSGVWCASQVRRVAKRCSKSTIGSPRRSTNSRRRTENRRRDCPP